MPFEPEPYAAGLRTANEQERRRTSERARRAFEEATRLANAIAATDSSVQTVFLFGSLATGDPARPDFDIDLALEGGDVYRAERVVEASSFQVDLVSLKRLPGHVQERIRKNGRVLYRRS